MAKRKITTLQKKAQDIVLKKTNITPEQLIEAGFLIALEIVHKNWSLSGIEISVQLQKASGAKIEQKPTKMLDNEQRRIERMCAEMFPFTDKEK